MEEFKEMQSSMSERICTEASPMGRRYKEILVIGINPSMKAQHFLSLRRGGGNIIHHLDP